MCRSKNAPYRVPLPPQAAECFFSPVLTGSPLPLPACCWRRSPLARGAPAFLDPASHFAAAKLLPMSVRVSHSPIWFPTKSCTLPTDDLLTPSDSANDCLACVPVGKFCSALVRNPWSRFSLGSGSGGRGRQPFSLVRFPQGMEDVKVQRGEAFPHSPFR